MMKTKKAFFKIFFKKNIITFEISFHAHMCSSRITFLKRVIKPSPSLLLSILRMRLSEPLSPRGNATFNQALPTLQGAERDWKQT